MGDRKEGRSTVYNAITSDEKLKQVCRENIDLENDFLEYLASADKSKETIKQYKANLHIFWCWNLDNNSNKFFVKMTKREFSKFQSHAINVWQWSPKRVRTVRATLSSLSNYIENILDDEFPGFKSIVCKIEAPPDSEVREKSVFKNEEIDEVLRKLAEDGEYMKACMLSLAANGGRRKAELSRFKIGYFRPEFTICNGALYKTPEKIKTKGRGAKGKLLNLYTVRSSFDPYLKLWIEERERLGIISEWLFPRKEGGVWLDEPIRTSTLDSWAKTFNKMFGQPFYWHSLRHYFTTKLSSSGVPSNVIQNIIGWESLDMVGIYDDTPKEDGFEDWFSADGIVKKKKGSLEEL